MRRAAWLSLMGVLVVAVPAGAELSREQQTAVLAEAQRAFEHGIEIRRSDPKAADESFGEAAKRFQMLVDSGLHNGGLYYNLGNAYLEVGQTGRAILNYRRADRLQRGDGRIEAMLRYARTLRRNEIPASGERAILRTLFFWHYTSGMNARWGVAVAAFGAFWLLMIVRVYAPRRALSYALIPLAVVAIAAGTSVYVEHQAHLEHRDGVILADDVVARKGDSEGFEPQFQQKLYQGVEFSLIENRGNWLHIELPDGKRGWIRADQAELI